MKSMMHEIAAHTIGLPLIVTGRALGAAGELTVAVGLTMAAGGMKTEAKGIAIRDRHLAAAALANERRANKRVARSASADAEMDAAMQKVLQRKLEKAAKQQKAREEAEMADLDLDAATPA